MEGKLALEIQIMVDIFAPKDFGRAKHRLNWVNAVLQVVRRNQFRN